MDKLRDLLLNNLGLKIMALLFAFLLWVNVASPKIIVKTVSVPVEFVNVPAGLEISNDYTRRVDVHLSADRGAGSVSGETLSVEINLLGEREGERIMPLTKENVQRPLGVEILSVTPSRITVVLEKRVEKVVPVVAEIVGTPAAGYRLLAYTADPPNVTVVGPASGVARVSRAVTEPIRIDGRRGSFVAVANVDVADKRLRIDESGPVRVTLDIEEERRELTVRVPVQLQGGVGRLLDPFVDVRVAVPKSFRGTLSAPVLRVTAAAGKLQPRLEPYALEATVEIDPAHREFVKVIDVRPATIRLRVLRR